MKLSLVLLVFLGAACMALRVKNCKHSSDKESLSEVEQNMVVEALQNFDELGKVCMEVSELTAEIEKQGKIFERKIIDEFKDGIAGMLDDLFKGDEDKFVGKLKELKEIEENMPHEFREGMEALFKIAVNEINDAIEAVPPEELAEEVTKELFKVAIEEAMNKAGDDIEEEVAKKIAHDLGLKGDETREEVEEIVHKELAGYTKAEWDKLANEMMETGNAIDEMLAADLEYDVAEKLECGDDCQETSLEEDLKELEGRVIHFIEEEAKSAIEKGELTREDIEKISEMSDEDAGVAIFLGLLDEFQEKEMSGPAEYETVHGKRRRKCKTKACELFVDILKLIHRFVESGKRH
eukprot:TRINITY_DN5447_c0_g1_i5.p1 TRINITY_DN5447_c0_g1~~TRINITY_DN5447_c0_g1_i5.p1  ORF type:complete len:351 (+),score=137.90 TRINITY_DN5447_c0_g1_i5:190-1242(+)